MEMAGIDHAGLVEIDETACATLRLNRPRWNVIQGDLNSLDGSKFAGVDIVSGGLPCPPFSVAGKQLGNSDLRKLLPATISLRPAALLKLLQKLLYLFFREILTIRVKLRQRIWHSYN
jgi:site-specific DNA-cytosine methylase